MSRQGEADEGVLVCTTGIGMSIAANRFPGVRAALCLTRTWRARRGPTTTPTCLVLAGAPVRAPEATCHPGCLARQRASPRGALTCGGLGKFGQLRTTGCGERGPWRRGPRSASRAIRREIDTPAGTAQPDRLRELRQRGRAPGAGLGADQQVRRGLPRQALVQRLRVRRRRRSGWPSTAPGSCSAPSMPTCSRTAAARPTWPSTSRCWSRATRSWP